MMSEAVKWDGFPVFGRDRDAWHLLNCDDSEHPIPMWWDWRIEAWKSDPEDLFSVGAPSVAGIGYSYLAGTVTPADLKEAIAEAVAAERERCAKACEGERLEETASDPTDISYAVAVERCIHAIRSAAK